MCGIAGFWAARPDAGLSAALARSLDRLVHRGPDDCGTVTFTTSADRGPCVSLGSRRLSIIDTSPSGHQPMTTADGRYSVTFNGAIYNYRELRAELEAMGRAFRSRSDTEVLLEAWAAWGTACLARFEGMFAFALLDRGAGRLVLARDPFGIKPLFYSRDAHRLVFASELAALFEFSGLERRVDAERVCSFLATGHTGDGDRTLFADVRQVPPAHFLEQPLDASGAAEPTRYWSPATDQRRDVSLAQAAEELRALVQDSVRLHLRSDVPLGFSLSGGLDSSSVLVSARRVLGPSGDLRAFGFANDEADIDESPWQRQAAAAAAASLESIRVTSADVMRDFDHTVDIQGEPFGSPTIYAQYRVFARAREAGVTVIVGGQGSDELFAGYPTYLPARAATLLMQGRWLGAAQLLRAAASRQRAPFGPTARHAFAMAMPATLERPLRALLRRGTDGLPGWVSRRWRAALGLAPLPVFRPRRGEALKEMLADTMEHAHLQGLLRFEDRSAMALSMESRVPFLTTRMARFALSLPESLLVSARGDPKAVLHEAMRGVLPDDILNRPAKLGFPVPVARWLVEQAPWVEQRLASVGRCPAIDPPELARRWRAAQHHGSVAGAYAVWRALTLDAWAERNDVRWT